VTSDESAGDGADPSGTVGGRDTEPEDGRKEQTDGGESDGTDSNRELARRVGLVVLGASLAVSVAGASGVFAAQSTVLDAGYVADTMAEENAYEELEVAVEDTMIAEANGSIETQGLLPNSDAVLEGAVRTVVEPPFVERETRRNLRQLYEYLHGGTPRLRLGVDPSPLVDDIPGAVESEVDDIPVAKLVRNSSVGGSFGGIGIDANDVADAIEDRGRYRRLQSNVSQETERANLSRDELNESLREDTDLGDLPGDVKDPVYRMQGITVAALTGDKPHGEYRSQMQAARGDLAAAVGDYAQQQVSEEFGSNVDLTENIQRSDRRQLDSGAGTVQQADTLLLVLPFLAVLLLVVVIAATHSLGRTARVFGASLLAAGVLGLLARVLGNGRAVASVRSAFADAAGYLRRTVVAVVEGLFGQVTVQSVVLIVAGLVFVGVWYAITTYEPERIPPEWR